MPRTKVKKYPSARLHWDVLYISFNLGRTPLNMVNGLSAHTRKGGENLPAATPAVALALI